MWIDSHCHLTHDNMVDYASPEELVARASEHGIDGMLSINCRMSDEFDVIYNAAKPFDNVWCTLGTHPHDAGDAAEQAISLDDMCARAQDPKIIGIGETGLDYYYDHAPRDAQEESFRKHIRACLALDLPMVVHARDADDDIIRVMRDEAGGAHNPKGLRGVMHCFSSGPQLAKDALDFGFYISFSGIVTFKKSDELREIAKTVPLDKILVETDAPFLAPIPFRGKVNEPSYVRHTGAFLADLLGVEVDAFAKQTSDNFFTLFSKAKLSL